MASAASSEVTNSQANLVFSEEVTGSPSSGDDISDYKNVIIDDGDLEQGKKKKVPRRILHFSDGIMEEYSTDEEEEEETTPPVNPKTLHWLPWLWYCVVLAATRSLGAADFCGEKLAWFFGITSPKYQYALDEYHRIKEEEQEEREMQQRENEAERARKDARYSSMEEAPPISKAVSSGGISNPVLTNVDSCDDNKF